MIDRSEEEIKKNWDKDASILVSVCCITYNQKEYIEQCIDIFLLQDASFPFEIIIHDDASTDGTIEISQEYEHSYPNIISVLYEEENQYSKRDGSISRIVNAACKGKYIAFCEGDDYWIDENKLQIQVDFLEANPEYGMCFSNCKIEKDGVVGSKITPGIDKDVLKW